MFLFQAVHTCLNPIHTNVLYLSVLAHEHNHRPPACGKGRQNNKLHTIKWNKMSRYFHTLSSYSIDLIKDTSCIYRLQLATSNLITLLLMLSLYHSLYYGFYLFYDLIQTHFARNRVIDVGTNPQLTVSIVPPTVQLSHPR